MTEVTPEINAMIVIDAALAKVEDDEAKKRVLRWVKDKFNLMDEGPFMRAPTSTGVPLRPAANTPPIIQPHGKEIPGIALIQDNGEFRLLVRNVKARSANDAAIRLLHIITKAHRDLTGQWASSKHTILPYLREWRAYDGNTRVAMGKEKGIIRNGDEVSLDFHAQNDADRYMAEVLDPNIEGTWVPSKGKKRAEKGTGEKPKEDSDKE